MKPDMKGIAGRQPVSIDFSNNIIHSVYVNLFVDLARKIMEEP